MRIEVAHVAPDGETLVEVDLADGATVDDAVRASGLAGRVTAADDPSAFAIFGRRVGGDTVLGDGDRVDITRPLLRDPTVVRRERATHGDTRRTGAAQKSSHRRSKT